LFGGKLKDFTKTLKKNCENMAYLNYCGYLFAKVMASGEVNVVLNRDSGR